MTRSYSQALRISDGEALRALWLDSRTGRRHLTGRIEIDLQGVPEKAREAHEDRINKAYFACGCAEAAMVGLAGLAAYAGWAATRDNGQQWWVHLLLGAAAFFVAGALGKLIGRRRADAQLRREVEALAKAGRIKLDRQIDTQGAVCAVN
ncbi:MAG TPA: hypothetical protein VF759_01070 [Allosphingosinicella sp.]|jgi:hypothetical protein